MRDRLSTLLYWAGLALILFVLLVSIKRYIWQDRQDHPLSCGDRAIQQVEQELGWDLGFEAKTRVSGDIAAAARYAATAAKLREEIRRLRREGCGL